MASRSDIAKDRSLVFYGLLLGVIGGVVGAGTTIGTYLVKNSNLQERFDEQSGQLKQVTSELKTAQQDLHAGERLNATLQAKLDNDANRQLSAQLAQCSGRLSVYVANDPILQKINDTESKIDHLNHDIQAGRMTDNWGSSLASAENLTDMRSQSKQYQAEIDDLSAALKCEPK